MNQSPYTSATQTNQQLFATSEQMSRVAGPQYAASWVCPFCHQPGIIQSTSKVSTGGWILFVLLSLSCVGLLLCWIPLVFMKDTVTFCPNCKVKINNY